MLEICLIFLPAASILILIGVFGTYNKLEIMYDIRPGIYHLFLTECKHLKIYCKGLCSK